MKKQLSLLIAIFGLLFTQTVQAQTYEHNLANTSNNTVEFVLSRSPISIQGYDGNQIIIKNSDYQAPPARAKGLHPISGNGPDNSGIGLHVNAEGNALKIVQSRAGNGDFTVKVPNNIHIKVREQLTGEVHISNHKGEIEVDAGPSADITLQNITGPVVAHTISGNIDAVFSRLSNAAPSSISTISGNIDITLPASTKTNLKLSSISGSMYTDFNIDTNEKKNDLQRVGGRDIKGTLNGGGVELKLKAVSGNIYLRKGK